MKQNKNILIRNLTEQDNQILDELRKLTKAKTNSQAVLKAIREYMIVKQDLDNLTAEYSALSEQYKGDSDTVNKIREQLGLKRVMNLRKKIVIKSSQLKI
jgi:hypothetical protein